VLRKPKMKSTALLLTLLLGIVNALPNKYHDSPRPRVNSGCPDPEAIEPCKCHPGSPANAKPSLDCSGLKTLEELKKVFQAEFPNKDFDRISIFIESDDDLYLDDIFNGVRFSEIDLDFSNQNVSISADFFEDSSETLEQIFLGGGLLSQDDFPFSSLRYYKRLVWFSINSNDKLSEIPPIVSDSLENVRFNENWNLKSLAEGVFEGCPNITLFDLESNSLTSLPARAFNIKSGVETQIDLWGNSIANIDSSVFILPEYNNETSVIFRGDAEYFQTLDKEIFQTLLNNTGDSYIDATYDPIVCNCSLAWVFDPSPTPLTYLSRIWGTCDNSTNFNDLDPAAFADCP